MLLWRELRRKALAGLRFRKQHPIGCCVLDFYLPSAQLAIEVDGLAHDLGDNPARDARLDDDSRDGVLRLIVEEARNRTPSASLRSAPPP